LFASKPLQLTFKLYASLTELLPASAVDHAVSIEVADGTSAWDVIDQFRVPRKSAHLVLINGVYLEPEDRAKSTLRNGDTIAVWPPVAGG
jgi:molybdopterin synthase sulfur carrier subunit